MNNKLYPLVLAIIIGAALYILYGDSLLPKQADLSQYLDLCKQYQEGEKGQYTDTEVTMLVAEINYLLPEPSIGMTDPMEKDVKACAEALQGMTASPDN